MVTRSSLVLMMCLATLACGSPGIGQDEGDAVAEACALSPLGEAVLDAALAAEPSRNTVPSEWMVTTNNRVGDALIAGPAIFPAVADVIAQAEHEVDIAMFVFAPSDAYDEILEGLSRLAQRRAAEGGEQPVVVRLVVDAQKAFFNTGPEIANRAFSGIAGLGLDPDHVQVLIATYEHFALGNLHTKSVIVDGRRGMLGGANVQPQHDFEAPWLDSFYAVEGEAAQTLLADFDHAWGKARAWHCDAQGAEGSWCTRWDDAPPIWHPAAVMDPAFDDALGCAPAIALNRTAWGGFNNSVDNPMAQGLLAAFDHAKHRIRIQTPNLNDDAVRDALVRAVARGVDVQLVLSLGFNERAMGLFGGGNEAVADDLHARVAKEAPGQAAHLQIRFYSEDGVTPVEGNVPGASHLKYLSVDDQLVVVGSTNMDTIAWNHSRETNLGFDSAEVTRRWDAQVFEPSFSRGVAW